MDQDGIRYLKGVGPKRESIFNRIGINTVFDLLYYFPLRYQDRRQLTRIYDLKENEPVLIRAKVLARSIKPFKGKPWLMRRGKNTVFQIAVSDGSAVAQCVWFNQGYLREYIKVGDELLLYGKIRIYQGKPQIVAPEYQVCGPFAKESSNMGRIVGFYPLTEGLTQNAMRKAIRTAFESVKNTIQDPLPFYIRKQTRLGNIVESLKGMHFPQSLQDAQSARERFIFEELFFSQILVYLRKARYRFRKSVALPSDPRLFKALRSRLTFTLTSSQEETLACITGDLAKPRPMHRLLQGDVGSGKTVVACFAIAQAAGAGYQVAFMVPTEVLAQQHYETLKSMFSLFPFRIALLTSSVVQKERSDILLRLAEGDIDIIIGTHALLEDSVRFRRLGLVVIDEQHKFGVAQRALLPKKAEGFAPHCLVMSATPIPRSLALSLYGDLDLSVIKELPPGRKHPETMLLPGSKRRWVYDFIRAKLAEKRQAYIVYPVIEESYDWDLKSLNEMHGVLEKEFNGFCVAVFHGRMNSEEKAAVVRRFRENKVHILISTTVIEVGVNIENAVVMVVENPERFGLAQLHQLRGRIRRSVHQPYFIMLSDARMSAQARSRLEVINASSDGFVIAEEDLKLRGPGDFFGRNQSGYPQLRIANPIRDLNMLKEARHYAYSVIKEDTRLMMPRHRSIREHLDVFTAHGSGFLEATEDAAV